MPCNECNRLRSEYEKLEADYAARASQYLSSVAAVAKANEDCEDARVKLEQHKLRHSKAN